MSIRFTGESQGPTTAEGSPALLKTTADSIRVNMQIDRSLKGLARFLVATYGNSPKFLIEIAESAAKFARRLKVGNNRFKKLLDLVEYGVPALVLTGDLYSKMAIFDRITKTKPNVYGEKELKIRSLLGYKNDDGDVPLVSGPFEVGKDVCVWVAGRPKTERFIVEGFYKYEDLKTTQNIWEIDRGTVLILVSFESRKFVWELSYVQFEDKITILNSDIYFASTGSRSGDKEAFECSDFNDDDGGGVLERLKSAVFGDFLKHFDVKNNVIYLNHGLASRKRIVFGERLNQYDVDSFAIEVRKVLKRGRKRGYAFVGVPGTGKSTIIRKLEDTIRDYPIVYITAENMTYPHDIQDAFKTLLFMQPCVVVVEDLDSYGFEDKNERLGVFLDCIDDVNRKLNVVIVATINDTKLVHYALINRPGRLDEVILVSPPSTPSEAYEVMQARFEKVISKDEGVKKEFPAKSNIDPVIFETIIGNAMTQADVCEMVEKAVLLKDEVNSESLIEALKSLLGSKYAIKACNFGGGDPNEMQIDGRKKTRRKKSKKRTWDIDIRKIRTILSGGKKIEVHRNNITGDGTVHDDYFESSKGSPMKLVKTVHTNRAGKRTVTEYDTMKTELTG